MPKIPNYLAHLVGSGTMTGKKPKIWDYPCLFISMVNMQGTKNAQVALNYAELREVPDFMRHLVGNIETCVRGKTHVVKGEVRRTRSPSIWVMIISICDREKLHVVRGKKFIEKQVSPFTKRFFTPKEDDVEIIRL